jgi:hypothetical protein
MDDDRPTFIEKQMGHKSYVQQKRNWGTIAIWLVVIALACGLLLYLAVWAKLIQ